MLAIDEVVRGHGKGSAFGRELDLRGNPAKAARFALLTRALVVPFYNERLTGTPLRHALPKDTGIRRQSF